LHQAGTTPVMQLTLHNPQRNKDKQHRHIDHMLMLPSAPDVVQPAGPRQRVQVGPSLSLPLARHGHPSLVHCKIAQSTNIAARKHRALSSLQESTEH
jgi:hypothetical protein